MSTALSEWIAALRANGFYRPSAAPRVPDVWCFRGNESSLIYQAGYGTEFDNAGIYLFLRDEGGRNPYEPLYTGNAGGAPHKPRVQPLSERIFQRYIPENPSHRYHPPRQLQIVDWHGENIRSDHPQWAADKRKLRAEGASNIRLQDAEFFSRNTAHLPYFTFYPIPGQPDEGIERHKDRIRSVEAAVIKATIDLGFETCNVLKPAPDWNLVGQS